MRWILLLLALAGVFVSAKALHIHNSTDVPPCSINEKWDCGVVNHSEYAEIHGMPVAWFGILGYSVLALMAIAQLRGLFFYTAVPALAFALRLTYIEKYVLQVWCLFCVLSQCIVLLLTILGCLWWLLGRQKAAPSPAAA